MKKIVVLLFISAFAVCSAQEPRPAMKIPVREYNAGVVQKGDVVVYSFAVKNVGKAPLQIIAVQPQCGCTVADWDKEVPPGGEGKITPKLDTATLGYGEQVKSITVKTNDPIEPNFSLRIGAMVSSYIRILPRDTVLMNARQGETAESQLILRNEEEGNVLEIRSVTSDSEYITAEVKKVKEKILELAPDLRAKEGDYVLTVNLSSKTPVGYLTGRHVIIRTNSKKVPEIKIRVSGRVTEAESPQGQGAPPKAPRGKLGN